MGKLRESTRWPLQRAALVAALPVITIWMLHILHAITIDTFEPLVIIGVFGLYALHGFIACIVISLNMSSVIRIFLVIIYYISLAIPGVSLAASSISVIG